MATLKSNYLAIILAVTASCSMSAFSSCVSSFSLGKNISNRCIYRNSQQVVEYMRQKGIEICNLRLHRFFSRRFLPSRDERIFCHNSRQHYGNRTG